MKTTTPPPRLALAGGILLGALSFLIVAAGISTAQAPAARPRPVATLGDPVTPPSDGKPAGVPERPPNLAESPPALPPAPTYPIDLCTALRLAEADNPTIGISRQAIQEALADRLRADALLLPSLR